jgi:hypothetical protein
MLVSYTELDVPSSVALLDRMPAAERPLNRGNAGHFDVKTPGPGLHADSEDASTVILCRLAKVHCIVPPQFGLADHVATGPNR